MLEGEIHLVFYVPAFPWRKEKEMFIGFAYQGKDIVFRFIIEYNS
jgi:hypothetical protein